MEVAILQNFQQTHALKIQIIITLVIIVEVKLIITEVVQVGMNKFLQEIISQALENILILNLILRLIKMKTKIINTAIDDLQVMREEILHQKMAIQTNLITNIGLLNYMQIHLKPTKGFHRDSRLSKEIPNQAESLDNI